VRVPSSYYAHYIKKERAWMGIVGTGRDGQKVVSISQATRRNGGRRYEQPDRFAGMNLERNGSAVIMM